MELKPRKLLQYLGYYKSFNRTFMELKHDGENMWSDSVLVLIGPSWN